MNQRIRELFEQAGFPKFDIKNEAEKFAELIIRECAAIGYDASYYECALNVSDKIKKHFEVE